MEAWIWKCRGFCELDRLEETVEEFAAEKEEGGWAAAVGFRPRQQGGGDGASSSLAMAQCTWSAVCLWWVMNITYKKRRRKTCVFEGNGRATETADQAND